MNKNHHLQQQYPPFVIPSSIYKVLFINEWTTTTTMDIILDHVQNCIEYTCDTESEKSNNELALLQLQTLPSELPSFVILVEFAHLPSSESLVMVKIKEFFRFIFRSTNRIYSWGPFRKEIAPVKKYGLVEWPIAARVIDIQVKFSSWYSWALSHCEICRPSFTQNVPGESVKLDEKSNMLFKCNCHKPSPYRPNEKWSSQKAIIYVYNMFLDKSMRLNHWAIGLDTINSTLSTKTRNAMVLYAINDCFATTCLVQPVLFYWSFKQIMNVNIREMFQASASLPPIDNEKMDITINRRVKVHALFDDIELISDDDDGEIYLSQCIEPEPEPEPEPEHEPELELELELNVHYEPILDDGEDVPATQHIQSMDPNNQLYEIISEDEQQSNVNHDIGHAKDDDIPVQVQDHQPSPPVKQKSSHQRRTAQARHRRNQKRNQVHRSRRFQQFITRQVYPRFTMFTIRKILRQYRIAFTHPKIVGTLLIIGVKNDSIKQENEQQLPRDIFDRHHYYLHRRQSRYST